MESINVKKIHALKKYKQQKFINKLLFYPLVSLTFGSFCTSPFWFPSTKTFVCVSIPRILSFFFSVKSLFILGNLIVLFLVRESKVRPSDSWYNNNNKINKQQVKNLPQQEKVGSGEVKKHIVSPSVSREVIFKIPFYCELVNLSKNERINGVGLYEKEGEVEEEQLWPDERIEKLSEERNDEVGEEVEESLETGESEVMIPTFSTDDLKRRVDNFIAKVNQQIRLEAEECLAFPC